MIRKYAKRIEEETYLKCEVVTSWHIKVSEHEKLVDVWVNKSGRFTVMKPYGKKRRCYDFENLMELLHKSFKFKKATSHRI